MQNTTHNLPYGVLLSVTSVVLSEISGIHTHLKDTRKLYSEMPLNELHGRTHCLYVRRIQLYWIMLPEWPIR